MQLWLTDFNQHRFQQLAVSFREALAEKARRDTNRQTIIFRAIQASGSKPGGEAMCVAESYPKGSSSESALTAISTDVEMLWKNATHTGGCILVWWFRYDEAAACLALPALMNPRALSSSEA